MVESLSEMGLYQSLVLAAHRHSILPASLMSPLQWAPGHGPEASAQHNASLWSSLIASSTLCAATSTASST
ncbi:hypothetical protein P3T43_007176 [Paraburkholderia sp. GAS41]